MYDNQYVLNINSPNYMKNNYEIALFSIRRDVNSANYINWERMNREEKEKLINELIKYGYKLSQYSCQFLCSDLSIILHSLNIDINTIKYADLKIQNNIDIIKYLIHNGYNYNKEDLLNMSISVLFDKEIMKYVLDKIGYSNSNDKAKERIIELFTDSLKEMPKIENFESRLQYIAEILWNEYREDNLNDYANIFGKICTELNNNKDFDDACYNLIFLPKMKEILESKYELLTNAMEEYHHTYHSDNKLEGIAESRNQISYLSALYISMSKEKYKKNILEDFYEDLKVYFIPRKDNYYIEKKITEYKQKIEFKKMFQDGDKEIYDLLENIVNGWSKIIDKDTVIRMIEGFLVGNYSKLDSFIKAPHGFKNYKRFEKAKKLINRLNSKYIKYTDLELRGYLDIIKYDNKSDEYYYYGPIFTKELIDRYIDYEKKQYIFEKLKQQIVLNAKKLSVDKEITRRELVDIREDVLFNDEYFEFDENIFDEIKVRDFSDILMDLAEIDDEVILNNESCDFIKKYLVNNNLLWIMLIVKIYENDIIKFDDLNNENLFSVINNSKEIISLAKIFNYDINNYSNIIRLNELSNCADEKAIAILGKDIILSLCENRMYTTDSTEEIVVIAEELISHMAMRGKSTVPYIYGSYGNYKYQMYDPHDKDILLSGINTNACFRIGGNDNDFLHYCTLDKNGFVIKIVDEFDNFIARASGFRNGNGVYINQLRTIYDFGGLGYEGDSVSEKENIIACFRKACQDIVDTSQNNMNERDKIDFVLVTQSYILENIPSNVSRETERKIGNTPMDYLSEDWYNFTNNTNNLQEIFNERDVFTTDYGEYSLICMAHSSKIVDANQIKLPIKSKNVEALYTRKRSRIVINNPNVEIINKINNIKGIYSYLNNIDYSCASYPIDSIVFVGDNWFIVYYKGKIIDSCLLELDKYASIEYESAKKIIESNIQLDYNPGKRLFLSKKRNF